jgi:hypothetical protein
LGKAEGTWLMSWTWRAEGADAAPMNVATMPSHPTQSDAESWLGESWRDLVAAGVAQVSLYADGVLVYGPMPLSE